MHLMLISFHHLYDEREYLLHKTYQIAFTAAYLLIKTVKKVMIAWKNRDKKVLIPGETIQYTAHIIRLFSY